MFTRFLFYREVDLSRPIALGAIELFNGIVYPDSRHCRPYLCSRYSREDIYVRRYLNDFLDFCIALVYARMYVLSFDGVK